VFVIELMSNEYGVPSLRVSKLGIYYSVLRINPLIRANRSLREDQFLLHIRELFFENSASVHSVIIIVDLRGENLIVVTAATSTTDHIDLAIHD
jgi:hypothetical protein